MNKKPFFKTLWFWIIVFGVLLLIGNILVLLLIRGNSQSAWLTLFSGWVSGIATLIIGLFAFLQNNRFTFDTRKRDLIFKFTNFMSELQNNFITKIDSEYLFNINNKIYDTTLHMGDPQFVSNAQIEINRDILTFMKTIISLESVMFKACFYSQEIIGLHESILNLIEKLNEYKLDDLEDPSKLQYIQDHCKEVSKFISEWVEKFLDNLKKIMLKYQKTKVDILGIYKLKDLVEVENKSYEEEKEITNYFRML